MSVHTRTCMNTLRFSELWWSVANLCDASKQIQCILGVILGCFVSKNARRETKKTIGNDQTDLNIFIPYLRFHSRKMLEFWISYLSGYLFTQYDETAEHVSKHFASFKTMRPTEFDASNKFFPATNCLPHLPIKQLHVHAKIYKLSFCEFHYTNKCTSKNEWGVALKAYTLYPLVNRAVLCTEPMKYILRIYSMQRLSKQL